MIPLRDRNPTHRRAVITGFLLAANIAVFFLLQPTDQTTRAGIQEQVEFTYRWAAIPCEITEGRPLVVPEVRDTLQAGDATACRAEPAGAREVFPDKQVWLAVVLSMFLHGSFLHLGGNMLFLWVFGNNIEDHLGHLRYLAFYLIGGVVATAAHVAIQPDSTVPMVGASGAVAAVMGAYLVWFPSAPITGLIGFFPIVITARWMLGFWFVSQFFIGPDQGIAWMAHVGGFVFGVLIGLLVRLSRWARRVAWTPDYEDPWRRRASDIDDRGWRRD